MKTLRQWSLTLVLLVLVIILLACQLDYFQLGSSPTPTPTRRPTLSATPTSGADRSTAPLPTLAPGNPGIPPTIAPPTAVPEPVMATATDVVRVRAAPSTAGAVIGRLNKGESAQIVGRTAAGDWWQIILPTDPNARGWVSAEFAPAGAATDGVPVVGPATPGQPTGPNPPPVVQPTRRPYSYP